MLDARFEKSKTNTIKLTPAPKEPLPIIRELKSVLKKCAYHCFRKTKEFP